MGNLVGTDGATLLSEIVVYSPLYVYFYISEREVFMLQEDSARRRKKMGKDWKHRDPSPIYVGRSGQDGYPFSGLVDYTALQIDAATGTFEVRGLLPNVGTLDEILMPGTFVRVQVPIAERKNALLVPERALGADQNGRFLLIANSENVVEQRSVQVGPARRDGTRVIKTGLTAQDWVITNGLQRARPGAKVDPTKEKLKSVSSEADRLKPVWPEGVRRPGAKDERVRPLSADGGHLPGDDEGSASDDTKTKPSEAPDSARDAATAGASPIEAGPAMSDPSKPAPADTTNPSIPPSQPVAPTGGQ